MEAIVLKIKLDEITKPLICYTAFNKTTETEFGERIRKKLLANNLPHRDIESRTLHSLCYTWFTASRGGEYLRDMKDSIEPEAVVQFFQLENLVAERYGTTNMTVNIAGGGGRSNRSKQQRIKFEAMWVAELILKTLENFLNSAAPDVTDKHLPYQIVARYREWTEKLDAYLIKHHILKTSAAMFYQRFDFKGRASALYKQSLSHNQDAGLSVTHSVYQKFVQLSNAVLTSKQNRTFDMYLVDEAQDLNECQCAIITRQWQQGSTIALVGDPAQSIYQFRGACRQFERWEVDNEETLTMSFRFGREVARVCNIMLGLEKLWLLSLRSTINPAALPGSAVKKEREGGAAQAGAGKQDGAAPADTEGSQMIQALVRGLPSAVDRWVKPNFALDYPYTVICRTNNNTYYALLAGIQEAIRQHEQAQNALNGGDNPDPWAPQGAAAGNMNTGESQANRKRPYIDPCDSAKRTMAYDLTSQSTTQSSGAAGTGLSGPSGFTPYIQHSLTQNARTQAHTQAHTQQQSRQQHNSYITPVLDRHAAAGPPLSAMHSSQQHSGRPPYSYASQFNSGGVATGHEHTQQGAHGNGSQVPVGNIVVPRKFFVNGVRSYAQLENGLVRRIEQLAGIGLQKPYLYKGEQYVELEGLKDAAREMDDIALLELVEITEKWGADLGNIKHLIRNHYADNAAEADVLVTTVHKSKGLEWDHVTLGEDIGHPLLVQQLFVIECSKEGGKFMVGLEPTSTSAFEKVNGWLLVGRPLDDSNASPADPVAAAAADTGGKQHDKGTAVKTEPGLQGRAASTQRSQAPPAKASASADVIDLMDDDDWTCSRCARSNDEYAVACAQCKLSKKDSDGMAARKKNIHASYHHDDMDADDDDYAGNYGDNMYNARAGDPPAPPSCFSPSHDNKLVPLLPSTIALGYQLQRGFAVSYPAHGPAPAGVIPGADSGNAGGVADIPRASKCPLICPYPSHHSCTARTQRMYQHELAERRRLYGAANVGALESAVGDNGPSTSRVVFSNSANDEIEVASAGVPALVPAGAGQKADPGAPVAVVQDLSSLPRVDPFLIKFSSRQNANEWYVAVSRAKKILRANADLATIMEWIERDIGGLRTQLRTLIGDEVEVHPKVPSSSK